MLGILEAFHQKGYTKLKKDILAIQCLQRINMSLVCAKIEIYGHDQNIGSPEKFCTGCPKMKIGLFWCKN